MKKIIITLLWLAFSLIGSFAQDAQPTRKPTPKPLENGDEVVKISTTLIQVDVTVTDLQGKVVTDLKPEEIEIYENGKKQQVSNFSFISNVVEVNKMVCKVLEINFRTSVALTTTAWSSRRPCRC